MTEDVAQPKVDAERRRQRLINVLVLVLAPAAVLLAAAVTILAVGFGQTTAQVDGLSKALTAQCNQTKRLGHKCVAAPAPSVRANPGQPTVSAQPGPSGPQGPGPSDAQVETAVAAYFAAHPVINDTPPDPATVQAFVDAYLVAHPAPAGSPGATGSPGANGQTGATGATGPAGSNGRGISNIACSDTHLVVTYDDSAGTTQDLGAGSCGQGPKGDQGEPVASYSYTVPGALGTSQTYNCVWDGESKTAPHYSCTQQ